MTPTVRIREATPDDRLAVRSIVDAAMLEVPDLDRAAVLVAVAGDERVVGALTATSNGGGEGAEITAVAVRPGRRGQGVGTALVGAAAERWTPLVAEFDAGVRGFYESLGFDVEAIGADRCRGRSQ